MRGWRRPHARQATRRAGRNAVRTSAATSRIPARLLAADAGFGLVRCGGGTPPCRAMPGEALGRERMLYKAEAAVERIGARRPAQLSAGASIE